jgi:hypothetical protein
MKLAVLLFIAICCYGQVTITGTFYNPDGSTVNGSVAVSLSKSTVTNTCASSQVLTFSPVRANIVNGVLGSMSLYATACLKPSQKYIVKVYGKNNTLLYQGYWTVPNTSSADVTELGN